MKMEYSIPRSFYRIHFPLMEQPSFAVDGTVHPVIDCSEKGLLYRCEPGGPPEVGQVVAGRVSFRTGQEAEVEGEVVRVRDGLVALNLNLTGIPFSIILSEQRRLYRRYIGFS